MTGPSSERTADAELRERVELCQAQVAESPYSHTVAANWYAVDVPALVARNQQLQEALEAGANYLRKISDPMCPPAVRQVALDHFAEMNDAALASVRARTPE